MLTERYNDSSNELPTIGNFLQQDTDNHPRASSQQSNDRVHSNSHQIITEDCPIPIEAQKISG